MIDSPHQKSGNANWAQCPGCEHWFHVASALLRMRDVALICPGCGKSFKPDDAKALIES